MKGVDVDQGREVGQAMLVVQVRRKTLVSWAAFHIPSTDPEEASCLIPGRARRMGTVA